MHLAKAVHNITLLLKKIRLFLAEAAHGIIVILIHPTNKDKGKGIIP